MHPELGLALELADIADALTLQRFGASDLQVETKADMTPVTEADRRTEDALRQHLRRTRPDHAVTGEEFGADDSGSEWRWLLDPIDGTKNYARGIPVWASLIALCHGDDPVCGVVSAPALRRRWLACRGEGAWNDAGETLAVSRIDSLDAATLSCTDFRDLDAHSGAAGFRTLASRCRIVRGFGDFWSHVLTAEGSVDVAIEAGVKPWDLAALQVIVTEAGGRLTDFSGVDRIDGGSAVTSNGILHDRVLRILAAR